MTIKEYSELMGYGGECPMEEYESANTAYMMAGDMDKQVFCREYRKVGGSPLVHELARTAATRDKSCSEEKAKGLQAAHGLLYEACRLREAGMGEFVEKIEGIAAMLVGRKYCVKWKLANKCPMGAADIEYVTENLR